MLKSKRYKWRLVNLTCFTVIVTEPVPFYYKVVQRKRRKIFADWQDIHWCSNINEAEQKIISEIERDNKNNGILIYSPLGKNEYFPLPK